jgi:hypothetical protein
MSFTTGPGSIGIANYSPSLSPPSVTGKAA